MVPMRGMTTRSREIGQLRTGLALLALLLTALPLVASLSMAGCGPQERFNGEVVEPQGESLELVGTNWNGEPFRLADLQGKVAVVFFGYTYCPDICPLTLFKMKQIYTDLGERAGEVAIVFVSVDPGRDSVAKLAEYVPGFDPRFYGVLPDSMEATREEFDLTVSYSQPKEGPNSNSFYYVDHTGTLFLFDRQGRLRLTHPTKAPVERLVPDIERLLQAS